MILELNNLAFTGKEQSGPDQPADGKWPGLDKDSTWWFGSAWWYMRSICLVLMIPEIKSINPVATYMLSHQKTTWVCFYHDFYNFFLIQIPENHMGRQVDHLQATIQSQLEGVSEGTVIQTFMYNDSDKILE